MKKIQHFLTAFVYSLPVQLVVRQLLQHKSLLLFWTLLLALLSGAIGESFGVPYIFLEPEYLGEENFWSFFIVGSALGAFMFAYMITFYINESYRFHFIALTKRPFFVFTLNNFLVPGSFLVLYLYRFAEYHYLTYGGFSWPLVEKIAGLLSGILGLFVISSVHFFAERTPMEELSKRLEHGLTDTQGDRNRRILLGKARESLRSPVRADNYFTSLVQVRTVDLPERTQLRMLVKVLNQNHGKLLLLQIFTFLFVAVLGMLEHNPLFQIPAGASVLMIFSLGLMAMGALSFWFRRSWVLTALTLLVLVGGYNSLDFFKEKNQAFGMDYEATPVAYTRATLDTLVDEETYQADRQRTLEMLEAWKRRYQEKYGYHRKPRAVFVLASGGGLRSAYWTFSVLQHLDSLSQGQLADEMRLMTGASGGSFGLTYYRELYWRAQQGEDIDRYSNHYQERISGDLLNRILFKVMTDMFMPNLYVEMDGQQYFRETGYSFDHQLAANLPELAGRRLGDYRAAEQTGMIPPIVLTPTVINQGRKLYVASNPVSFLTRPHSITDRYQSKAVGIEFRRMFREQGADSLYMTTALRMNATFPFVLPLVELPSEPVMEVMDAGAIDNYGTQTAVKYLFEFRDWFARNTEGIVFVQIRDNDREDPIEDPSDLSALAQWLKPLGGGISSMAEAKDMNNDFLLEFVKEWYRGQVEIIPVEYPRESTEHSASLSWHLTQREKQNILQGMDTPLNQQAVAMVEALYEPRLLARRE